MKPLVIYYSMTGNNAFLAKDLQDRMKPDIQEIREKSKRGITRTIDNPRRAGYNINS